MKNNKNFSNQEVGEDIKKTIPEQSNEFDPSNSYFIQTILK